MRQSGLAELLPSLEHLVYVGVSAGSIAMSYNQNLWITHLSRGAAYLPL
jgi:hypothetical protein